MESVSKIRLWILQVGRSIRSVAHDTGVGEVDFLITRMIDAKLSFDRDLLSSAETDVGHKAAKKLAVMIACSAQEQTIHEGADVPSGFFDAPKRLAFSL